MRILAGDIGGSKTLLQLADYAGDAWQVVAHARYDNHAYADFEAVLSDFCQPETGIPTNIDSVCLAVAGPIKGEEVQLTNRPWSIHADRIRVQLSADQVHLVNDLEGAGYGVAWVDPADLLVLNAGAQAVHGVCALIGAGTGLGEAWMTWCDDGYKVFAGEGGHVDFAPRDALEVDLLTHISATIGRVSYEHLLSGAGLKRMFDFLHERGDGVVSSDLARGLAEGDPASVICDYALSRRSALARRALERYISVYGAQAANLALTVGARGGVYVVGGIAPKISAALRSGGFMAAFLDNPTMSDLLKRIPVTVVLDPEVALLGARAVALRRYIN